MKIFLIELKREKSEMKLFRIDDQDEREILVKRKTNHLSNIEK